MVLALTATLPASAKDKIQPWQPIDPAELRDDKPAIDPGAAAEAITWTLDVDDRAYPEERTVYAYIRYKIYDPKRAVDVTRLSELTGAYDGISLVKMDLRARLTLPNGETKEFGKESIQERDTVHEANSNTWFDRLVGVAGAGEKEKFLAIGGIQPGAVIEYQSVRTLSPGSFFNYTLQSPGHCPVRHLEATFRFLDDKQNYLDYPFLLNTPKLNVLADADPKTETLRVKVDGLPALFNEPFSPPVLDRSLALIGSYVPRKFILAVHHGDGEDTKVNRKAGPWGALATKCCIVDQDATQANPAVTELAARLTKGAATEAERAHRIHNYTHALFLRYLDSPQKERNRVYRYVSTPLEKVIALEDNPNLQFHQIDFFWLAVALYRAAGLKTEVLMLPNRGNIGFSPDLASEAVLPEHCARVFADGKWQFSMPDPVFPEPFGSLPWFTRGYVGLPARINEVAFIKIPPAPASDSVTSNFGTLDLAADGSLTGKCRRIWTGDPAVGFKERLRTASQENRLKTVREQLKRDFKFDGITVTKLSGADDIDAPLIAEYEVQWPDFAASTKRRLIFRPAVFHGLAPNPFTEATRHNAIDFRFSWREVDQFDIRLPAGCALESPAQSFAQPGDAISYHLRLVLDEAAGRLRVQRVFVSNLHHLPVSAYGELKDWYGSMGQDDGVQLVLVKPRPVAPASPPAAPKPASAI